MVERASNLLISLGAITLGTSLFVRNFFYTVDAGERAIIFDRLFGGLKGDVIGEGMHFYLPMIQTPIKYEIRSQPKLILSSTGTKDLQTIDISLRILHRPMVEYLPSIYTNIGLSYEEKILPSIGNEVLKALVAQYDADQLLKLREKISSEIKENLIARARDFNIALDDVSIIHLSFLKEYTQAIEHKQVAQQQAERQKFIVLRDEEEKNAAIIRSEGEAEAAKIINDSVKNFGGAMIEIRRLEAAKHIAEVLAKSPNITWIPGGNTGNLINLR